MAKVPVTPTAKKIKFRFIAGELRDKYVCEHFTMMEGDIVELDPNDELQNKLIRMMTGEDVENSKADFFVIVEKGAPTVSYEEVPEVLDPAKVVEAFLVKYKTDEAIRRQANARGIRVLEMGEQGQ